METLMSSDETQFQMLCGKLRDDSISAAEFAQLESRLLTDEDAADYYVRFMSVCSGIEQLAAMDAEDEYPDESSGIEDDLSRPVPPHAKKRRRRRKPGNQHATLITITAGVCVALLVGAIGWFGFYEENPGNPALPVPAALASLVDVHEPVWSDTAQPQAGDNLDGTYSLVAGAARVRFGSGAELLVQSPSTFSIESSAVAALESGSLMLFVPESAKGFKVTTPWGTVIDRGTRIGIRSNPDSGLEAHVFEGRGEVVGEDSASSGILEAGQAATVSAEDQTLTLIDVEESYFLASLGEASRLPEVSGDVKLLMAPPRSVRRVWREVANLRCPIVFAEQRSVPTDTMSRVTHTGSGVPKSLQAVTEKLAAGNSVDSYFVHFTMPLRERSSGEPMHAQGALTFKRPIVAVVTHEPVRFAKFVGHQATEYQRDMETGLEDAVDDDASRADSISISEDLRTVTFRLNITGLDRSETPDDIDQFRVLVDSTEE